jgi:hypothetical protein
MFISFYDSKLFLREVLSPKFARPQSSRFVFIGAIKNALFLPPPVENIMDVHQRILSVKSFTTVPEALKVCDSL